MAFRIRRESTVRWLGWPTAIVSVPMQREVRQCGMSRALTPKVAFRGTALVCRRVLRLGIRLTPCRDAGVKPRRTDPVCCAQSDRIWHKTTINVLRNFAECVSR